MRVVIQRVQHASVTIDGKLHSAINHGLLVLAGMETLACVSVIVIGRAFFRHPAVMARGA